LEIPVLISRRECRPIVSFRERGKKKSGRRGLFRALEGKVHHEGQKKTGMAGNKSPGTKGAV